MDEVLDAHGHVVIVDLHSYPSLALPYEVDPDALRPGVCIGTDRFHTAPRLSDKVEHEFAGVRGGTAHNTPFGGTYVPLRHWHKTAEVASVMLEIRRDLYQHEPGGAVHDGYEDIAGRLRRVFRVLAER